MQRKLTRQEIDGDMEAVQGNGAEESVEIYDPMDCERLWKLMIPPKVKIFLWRLAHEILPTGKNIELRKKEAATECPFCFLDETQNHIFRECQWAIRIWRDSMFKSLFEVEPNLSAGSWLCAVMDLTENEILEKLGILLWLMWNERNNHMFNKKKAEEWEIVGRALAYWEEFQLHHTKEKEEREGRNDTWEKPQEGWVKLNVDAAVLAEEGTGLGVVARDANGQFLLAAVRRDKIKWPPELAELRAIAFGVETAEENNFQMVEVESDCLNAIHQMQAEEMIRLEGGVLAREIKTKAARLGSFCWRFTKRTGNEPAHAMAHLNCNWDTTELWVHRPPLSILSFLEKDV
ncbi:unnamed protein product [Linum trigynum]|uniref:Uncharacterized protein n=1 Tax=Linum trigynum TaxID=586398 RepID=A0AAV2CAK8_9ROSI